MNDRDTLTEVVSELRWIAGSLVGHSDDAPAIDQRDALMSLATRVDALASGLAGWRPPARKITTAEQMAELGLEFPCLIREDSEDPTEFYPQMWAMALQAGWYRVGEPFDPNDCTPRLPVTVVHVPTEAVTGE